MSDAYNKKMEVRKARECYRLALHLAKKLFKKYSNQDATVQRALLTIIRNIIISTREADLKIAEPKK